VLARIAADDAAPTEVRVPALRHLPANAASADLLSKLLDSAAPVLRVLALEKIEQAHVTTLAAAVERLTRDPHHPLGSRRGDRGGGAGLAACSPR
jgi:hypothetical protein